MFMTLLLMILGLGSAHAATLPVQVGDPLNGRKLFSQLCGDAAARATFSSAEMAAIGDERLHAAFSDGNCVDSAQSFSAELDHLDAWDMVAFVRTRHLGLGDFFPDASRYLQKEYTIDKYGKARLEKALGRVPDQLTHVVFTFFDFEGEKGNLRLIPQDPIMLSEMTYDKKSGYVVFVPLETKSYRGEVGIGFTSSGDITHIAVHSSQEGADALNAKLASYVGLGKMGRTDPLVPKKNAPGRDLSSAVTKSYLLAMEAATMFVREERKRTWN